jgi:hypothetical protein
MPGILFRILEARLFVRPVTLRTPFRFGAVTVRQSDHILAQVRIEGADGRQAVGCGSDALAAKWFDKNPGKSERQNVLDLGHAAERARAGLLASPSPRTLFAHWLPLARECVREAQAAGLPAIVGSFAASLFERAMFEALGRLTQRSFHRVILENLAALDPGAVHAELRGFDLAGSLPRAPLAAVHIRHTVGMLDPLVAGDLGPGGGVGDGLPETLTDYLQSDGIRYLKVKIGGNPAQDLERLIRVSETVAAVRGQDYTITLDGNEQYRDPEGLMTLLERMRAEPRLRTFFANLLFVEQPIPREAAFDPALQPAIERLSAIKPLVLDEADGHLEAFKQGVNLGWRGVSAKNCKGVIQSLLNRSLVQLWSTRAKPLLLSAEDLTVVPVIGLQQDLTTVATLGLPHVEKNGHHYVRGCAHCTPQERQGLRAHHASLYRQTGNELFLHIQGGQVDLTSLRCPGYGVGFEVDPTAFPEWERWERDSAGQA